MRTRVVSVSIATGFNTVTRELRLRGVVGSDASPPDSRD